MFWLLTGSRFGRSYRRPARHRPAARRLTLEALEDRCVPSTIAVTTLDDSGPGSLRQAILDANTLSGADTITFAPGLTGTMTLNNGLPDISSAIDLEGPGAGILTVQVKTSGIGRVFHVTAAAGSVSISGLTVVNGFATAANGGGILNDAGTTLTVSHCTFTGNGASNGGAIANNGTLILQRCTIANNFASGTVQTVEPFLTSVTGGSGGGVWNAGTMTIVNSTVASNRAWIQQVSAPGTVTFAPGQGGGIANSGTLTVVNSTVATNIAEGASGGGIANSGAGTATLQNTIVALNTLKAVPVALPATSGPDVFGPFVSLGHNLIGDGTGGSGFTGPGDQVGGTGTAIDPHLGPLQNNGGPTPTMALLSGSPARDAGDDAVLGSPFFFTTDQRGPGFPRRSSLHVDIGAFEANPVAFVVTGADAGAQPLVRGFDAQGNVLFSFMAFDAAFTGGVRVATADVNGDGTPDIIAGAGPGAAPHVKVFSGNDLSVLASFYAFAPTFLGGVFVAAGRFSPDVKSDIVVAADAGADPHVVIVDAAKLNMVGASGQIDPAALRFSIEAFAPGFSGGVRVAVGDVNADGTPEIIAGAGPGAGPHVRVIDGANLNKVGPDGSIAANGILRDFYAFGAGFGGGVWVAAGDLTGDGKTDIVVGAGPGAGPHVEVFDGASGALLQSYYAFGNFDGGVRVATTTIGGGPGPNVVTSMGPRGLPQVRRIAGAGGSLLTSWFAYDVSFLGGVFVGG